jgi:hypothetical protein
MRARDQFDTQSAKQIWQLAHEKRFAFGKSCRRPIFRERDSWHDDGHDHCKKDDQNAHIMSPFMELAVLPLGQLELDAPIAAVSVFRVARI